MISNPIYGKKYEFVNWDDELFPINMGKFKKWPPNHQPAESPPASLEIPGPMIFPHVRETRMASSV